MIHALLTHTWFPTESGTYKPSVNWTVVPAANTLAMEQSAQLLIPQSEATCYRRRVMQAQQAAVLQYAFVCPGGPYLALKAAFPKP